MELEDVSDEQIEWEARRIGAAFGVDRVSKIKGRDDDYRGFVRDIWVVWHIRTTFLIIDLCVSKGKYISPICRVYKGTGEKWEVTSGGDTIARTLIARGIYCLGIEGDEGFEELDYALTAHEKLELRLSMPREFWPQKWLDEEKTGQTETL